MKIWNYSKWTIYFMKFMEFEEMRFPVYSYFDKVLYNLIFTMIFQQSYE